MIEYAIPALFVFFVAKRYIDVRAQEEPTTALEPKSQLVPFNTIQKYHMDDQVERSVYSPSLPMYGADGHKIPALTTAGDYMHFLKSGVRFRSNAKAVPGMRVRDIGVKPM
jgi:hypothetical protein